MKAAFALLANAEAHNLVRKLSWAIHHQYRTGLGHCCLPPHVSLKQPFRVTDLAALEAYMAELAASIAPVEIALTELQVLPTVFEGKDYGILWVDVQETALLRQLHERLNIELSQRFGRTQAPYDGPDYQFHMTAMVGGQPTAVYRQFYAEIGDPYVNLSFMARELAMFVYDEPMGPNGEYMTYRILPLGHAAP